MKISIAAAAHRPGHCAQHYHLIRLDWINPETGRVQSSDFETVNAQFFVLGKSRALIMAVSHSDISAGVIPQTKVIPFKTVRLAAIAYKISACGSGNKIVWEDFVHKFKKPVTMRGFVIESRGGPLWTFRPLNHLLSCSCFGGVQGAQFLA